jgi:hypothetical protein
MLRRTALLWVIFAALMGFAAGGTVVWSSQPPPSAQQNSTSDQRSENKGDAHGTKTQSLWVPIDSVGLYTLVLCVFTGILATVSIFQGVMLLRSDKTARIAANAAKQSADAAIAIELPVFRMGVTPLQYGQSLENGVLRHHCSISYLEFANLGRTKAFPIAVQFGCTAGESLPKEPVYPFSKSFPIETIWDPTPENTVKLLSIVEFEFEVPPTLFDDLRAKKTKFWFYCSLGYLDFMQKRHDAGFCWQRHELPGGGKFVSDSTPTYNRKT